MVKINTDRAYHNDQEYLDLIEYVLCRGDDRTDRTGVGTKSIFGTQSTYYLDESFPAITTKKLHFSSVVKEILWFLKGSTNIAELDCGIWDAWADKTGDLGPIYGHQWRDWGGYRDPDGYSLPDPLGVDQISNLVSDLKTDPFSRRHILTAWNPSDLEDMKLQPCHVLSQYYVDNQGGLSCHLYQRSCDLFLGCPFNIAGYALLTSLLAHVTGLQPYKLVHSIGDAHIYNNHIPQVEELLSRKPLQGPTLYLNHKINDILKFTVDDIQLVGYTHHPSIKAEVAV